jgi:hypothetical protein
MKAPKTVDIAGAINGIPVNGQITLSDKSNKPARTSRPRPKKPPVTETAVAADDEKAAALKETPNHETNSLLKTIARQSETIAQQHETITQQDKALITQKKYKINQIHSIDDIDYSTNLLISVPVSMRNVTETRFPETIEYGRTENPLLPEPLMTPSR